MSALGDVAGRELPSDAVGLARHLIGWMNDDSAVAAYVRHQTGRNITTERVAQLRRKAQPSGRRRGGSRVKAAETTGIYHEVCWRNAALLSDKAFCAAVERAGGWRGG